MTKCAEKVLVANDQRIDDCGGCSSISHRWGFELYLPTFLLLFRI